MWKERDGEDKGEGRGIAKGRMRKGEGVHKVEPPALTHPPKWIVKLSSSGVCCTPASPSPAPANTSSPLPLPSLHIRGNHSKPH